MDVKGEKHYPKRKEVVEIGLFTHQPFSSLGKVAFWTSLIATLAGFGGVIALTITNGSPSRDIVIATVLALLMTVLLATRIRWMQVISAFISIGYLYMIFTEPFVTESLAAPKGPTGGYGHFVGDMLIIALAIIEFAASIGTILQNYFRMSRKTPSWFMIILNGALGLVIGGCFIGALAQPPTTTASALTYTNGVPTLHLSPGKFDAASVTISKGSKLLLVDSTSEQHVLSNGTWQQNTPVLKQEQGAPLVNNITLSGNSVTIGPFTMAGTYHILCTVHRGMNLTINVQ